MGDISLILSGANRKLLHFSVSHVSVWLFSVAETMTEANPKVTLFLLQKLESDFEDAKLKSDPTELIALIREKTAGNEQKR